MSCKAEIDQADYRPIEGWDGYLIGDNGLVLSCKHKGSRTGKKSIFYRTMKTWPGRGAYPAVRLRNPGGQTKIYFVHLLVLETFVSPRPPGAQARHLNADRSDSRLSNLAWGTGSQNMLDKRYHSTSITGERHPNSKLRDSQIHEILNKRSQKQKLASIAKEYGVSFQTISDICRGKLYRHITDTENWLAEHNLSDTYEHAMLK